MSRSWPPRDSREVVTALTLVVHEPREVLGIVALLVDLL